jgi:cytochrome c-type biogenesis protein CcmF
MSLASLGPPSLLAALAFAAIGTGLSLAGAIRARSDLVDAGRRAIVTTAIFVGLAVMALVTALFAHDFSLAYVANYTSTSLEGRYMLTALWGGMEGSLLFWTLLLTTFSAIALTQARRRMTQLSGWAAGVLGIVAIFFLALLNAPADPFARLSQIPADGAGLNPLLQSPGMLIHPPLLYTGFVGFSIPFAFGLAALLGRRADDGWFTFTRRWTLFAWTALSIGIVLGGAWAYTELGWGGYWAWDPVENASFMPWLTATAFLHSVIIQEKRRMLKVWNISLIVLTYVLAVFGTFLTRSGILSSIHTFTEGPIGKWFLPFLAAMLIGGLAVIVMRLDVLRSENRLDSLLSREAAFLANNVLFLAAAFTVLWGTVYPIVAEALTGTRLSVGPPFFESVFVPIALLLLALAGLGPLISWRRMSSSSLMHIARIPVAGAVAVAAILAALGVRGIGTLVAFGLCAFTLAAVVGEFVRGSRLHRRRDGLTPAAALARTIHRNRRRYGGYIVHLGIVLIAIGLAGAAFRIERQALVAPGETMEVGEYTLAYGAFLSGETPEKETFAADLEVRRGDDVVARLAPQRNFHKAQQQWQSEVAIRTNPVEDLYVVVTSFDRDGTAALRAFVNPLTWWIWAGAAVMAGGMATILWSRAPARAIATAPRRVRKESSYARL